VKDIAYLLEMALIIALPFTPILAGIILRRRGFRRLGAVLIGAGILAVLFCVLVVLNFKGVI
jgi:hypothetical protein